MRESLRKFGPPLVCGLLLRLLLLVLVDFGSFFGDERGFRIIAENLVQHGAYALPTVEYPTCLRPPLFPFFVAGHYFVWGVHKFPIQLTQSILSLGTAGLIYRALKASTTPRTAMMGFWLCCLDPFGAMYAGRYLAETLTTFFLVLSVTALMVGQSWRHYVVSGIAIGLTCLARDGYLLLIPFPPLLLLLIFAPRENRSRIAQRLVLWVVYCLCAVLVIAPWTLRNYKTFGSPVPISRGNLGFNLWVGTWERDGKWQGIEEVHLPDYAFDAPEQRDLVEPWISVHPSRAGERDRFFMALAKERWARQPWSVLLVCAQRNPRMWVGTRTDLFAFRLDRYSPPWLVLKSAFLAFDLLVLVLAAVSVPMVLVRKFPLVYLMILPVVYTEALYFLLHNTETRYSQPVFPFLLALASITLVHWFERKTVVAPGAHG